MTEAWNVGDVVVVNRNTDTGRNPTEYVLEGTLIVLTAPPKEPGSDLWTATIPSTGVTDALFFPSEWDRP